MTRAGFSLRVATLLAALIVPRTAHAAPPASAPALPAPVRLAFDQAANARYAAEVTEALAAIQRRLTGRLCQPLLPGLPLALRPAACGAEQADARALVHAVVLRDGVFWRSFSTHPRTLEEPLMLGSVSKALAGVPLLALGGANADEHWCVEAFAGIANADGYRGVADCTVPAAQMPAQLAMAKSNNLAMVWRLRRLPDRWMRLQLKQAGAHNVPATSAVSVAVALGTVEYTPRQALECFDALVAGRARRAAMVATAPIHASPFARWCASAARTPDARRFIDRMLAAPAGPQGTAGFAVGLLPGAAGLAAKTGTPSTTERLDTGKVLVASFRRGGHRYTFFLSLLSLKPSQALATKLNASDLADLVRVVDRHTRPNSKADPRPIVQRQPAAKP